MTGYTQSGQRLNLYSHGYYVITVQGEVEPYWEREVNMRVTCGEAAGEVVSTLAGILPDQSALLGVLQRLNNWGYPIMQVRHEPDGSIGTTRP